MKPSTRQSLSPLFGLLLLTGFGYGLFVAIRFTGRIFASLKSEIAVAIIAAAATVFVSVVSIVLAKIYESQALIQKEHREKKVPVYEDLIRFMTRISMGTKTGDTPSEREMLEFMATFTQRIMVWGSDDVLTAWAKWRRQSIKNPDLRTLMILYEQLILTIRRDLGHQNKGFKTGDVLALFVNDIDEFLKTTR